MLLVTLPVAWTAINNYLNHGDLVKLHEKISIGFISFEECSENLSDFSVDAPKSKNYSQSVHVYCTTISTEYGGEIRVAISTNRDHQKMGHLQFKNREVIFWHPGGPGISPVDEIKRAGSLINPKKFTVVAWDGRTSSNQRGACGEVSLNFGIQRASSGQALWKESAKVASECEAASTNPNLTDTPWLDLSSAGEADEIESIRKTLGLNRVHFWASSYGASIAVAYANKYPSNLGRSVLVSPYFETINPVTRLKAMADAMDRVEADWALNCQENCVSSLQSISKQGWEKVRAAVVKSKPKVGSGMQVLSQIEFDQAMVSASRYGYSTPELLNIVEAAYKGDGSMLSKVSSTYFFGVNRAKYYSVLCRSWSIKNSIRELLSATTSKNSTRALFSEFSPCQFWKGKRLKQISLDEETASQFMIFTGSNDVISPSALLGKEGWSLATNRCIVKNSTHDLGQSLKLKKKIELYLRKGFLSNSKNSSFCES